MDERKISIPYFGFTLIELLIIVSIMGLLMTVGLAYYQNFNRRQIVVQAARDLKNNLRLAQSKALAGEKIEGCSGTFGGYRVDFYSDEYVVSAICNGNLVEYKRYPLQGTEWADGPSYLIFKPLAGGVYNPEETGPAQIILSGSGTHYSSEVAVSESGEIAAEDNVPYVPPPTPTPTPEATPTPGGPPPLPPEPTPTPTPSCIPEGEIKQIYLGAPDCCPGLTPIPNYTFDEQMLCQLLLGGEVCAYCPNGVCGPGENECNCFDDCGGPTCISGTGTECGTGSCACYQRHDWQISDPPGCTGEEDFDTCTWDSSCFSECFGF